MNLLCPTCQKQLQVPEQYAGQMMKCPLCTATFTVPVLPQMPAAAAPPPMQQHITSAPSGKQMAPAPGFEAAGGQPQTRGLTINPRLIPWIAPLCLIGIFVLMFFPWEGMYPGGVGVVTQSGWQAPFGMTTADNSWERYATDERTKYWDQFYGPDSKATVEAVKAPGVSVWLIFFVLMLLPALLASVVSVGLSTRLLPIALPEALASFWSMRTLFVGGLTLACLGFLFVALLSGLPVEQKAAYQVNKAVEDIRKRATPAEDKDQQRWDIETGIRLGGFALRSTLWLTLVVILNVFAVVGAVLEFWIERRGTQPFPRLELIR